MIAVQNSSDRAVAGIRWIDLRPAGQEMMPGEADDMEVIRDNLGIGKMFSLGP